MYRIPFSRAHPARLFLRGQVSGVERRGELSSCPCSIEASKTAEWFLETFYTTWTHGQDSCLAGGGTSKVSSLVRLFLGSKVVAHMYILLSISVVDDDGAQCEEGEGNLHAECLATARG